jgi:hypothetical protein
MRPGVVGHAKYPPLSFTIVAVVVGTVVVVSSSWRLNALKTSETSDVSSSKVTLWGAFVGSGAVLFGVDVVIVGSAAPKFACCDRVEKVLRST